MSNDFPCHSKPKDQRCDRAGPGGFMGHTCIPSAPEPLTRDELLVLLIEEASEVIKAATKCLRFGFDADHGVDYGKNDVVLAAEYGDMHAIATELRLMSYPEFRENLYSKITRAEKAKAKYGRTPVMEGDGRG